MSTDNPPSHCTRCTERTLEFPHTFGLSPHSTGHLGEVSPIKNTRFVEMMKLFSAIFASVVLLTRAIATPTPPADVVFKPTFLTGFESLTAGTGFVLRLDGDYVFVTAHHLFGPAAGLERDLSPAQAKEFAVALAASSMSHHSVVITSSQMLLIPSAKACNQKDSSHDVASFRLSNYPGPALVTARIAPKRGDKIYLLARPRGESSLRLISGAVNRVGTDVIEYFYDEAGVNLAGTSGAPIINESGEVVAINLGGGDYQGRTFGFGNPAGAFGVLLSDAIKPTP